MLTSNRASHDVDIRIGCIWINPVICVVLWRMKMGRVRYADQLA